jgi:glutamate/tyrosine decarboxylase-like PLP-dependent enzyme
MLPHVHRRDRDTEALTEAIVDYAVGRIRQDPPPLNHPCSPEELEALAGSSITPEGVGGFEALRRFTEVLAPACISVDHPRYLSFVPAAPTEAAILFDLVVGASTIYAGSWLEGSGAVYAENEALRWISDLAGLGEAAGGVFVSGGTAGNLSALIAARHRWRDRGGRDLDRVRGAVVTSSRAHSSIRQALRAMDSDLFEVPTDDRGRLEGASLREGVAQLADEDRDRIFAVVATAGTTNAGVVDDLDGAAQVAEELGCWFHVDGAYGGAALAAPSVRHLFSGVERADSFIVDPHKWLFGPFDCCALVYAEPALARAVHAQHAEYLAVLHTSGGNGLAWNPSDYAHHLSRRARGLPLWFSLATHGTDAYVEAIEASLATAHGGADLVRSAPHLELAVEPELSVVVFRRLGWGAEDYGSWSERMLKDQLAFVVPSAWGGEPVLRMCVVNPLTTLEDIRMVVDSLA